MGKRPNLPGILGPLAVVLALAALGIMNAPGSAKESPSPSPTGTATGTLSPTPTASLTVTGSPSQTNTPVTCTPFSTPDLIVEPFNGGCRVTIIDFPGCPNMLVAGPDGRVVCVSPAPAEIPQTGNGGRSIGGNGAPFLAFGAALMMIAGGWTALAWVRRM